ncbi:glycosyltransferase [Lunatibacter salilacus]|uniref:glycosyltransferase n=1 Tax=Lunatibacter salilacus TaxID=2483804 RepID=UPI00131CC5A4|nr:glycosyltransferase [Lunatibacter salilacus]
MSDSLLKISVCVITFNHEKYIRQAIENILMQKGNFKVELIIADDASTDQTSEIIQNILKNKPCKHLIRYFRHSNNLGMSKNFFWALKKCSGKYIAFCEGDDYWTDVYKLQKQVDFLEKNRLYSLIFTRFKLLYEKDNILKNDSYDEFFITRDFIELDIENLEKGWHLGTQTMMFRKNDFDFNGNEEYKYFRDVHLFYYFLLNGKIAIMNSYTSVYRIHNNGVYSSKSYLEKTEIGLKCYQELYSNNKEVRSLRNKYYKYLFFYSDALIKSGKYSKSISIIFRLFFESYSVKYLLLYFKNTIKIK